MSDASRPSLNPLLHPSEAEPGLPCAEALLAGTLALMTGYAHSDRAGDRDAMGRKIAAHLESLARMDGLSPHFRTMAGNLNNRWSRRLGLAAGKGAVVQAGPSAAELQRRLWHTAPEAVQ
ncbi:hypothetical protein C8246_07955 [Paracidovorax avenae]|uniref:hypothetical protein n=1 Tax=Paracidovorax avenae TaxID=80867 RepID=UPI000D2277C9|nr:hypothetical protein [Paracidovorax avenae]AVS91727.1 hypothetical protein C8246_07955 [Paracidovorax avenae]AVS95421.1 hypothetical protein C8232_03395 [Paracidovorax avenae]AVS98512.1 hypothetical protein C8236_06435 [Paracidovorax avenae]AVT02091.1 hypothetical protein C8243_05920 [Paracidovorax avenae]AVT05554.1 hypothetical protein C8248_05820 [Paracidovorax avenae]